MGEWGDLERVDMTFSVAKSYLSTVAGLALRDGLINDLQRPVAQWVRDGHFESEHNRQISWRQLLQQTSDWSGTLWDVPDWADRPEGDDPELWPQRVMHEPGSYFKYNDVRVNLLAYSLVAGLARTPAAGAQAGSDGPDWRLQYLALAWI